MGYTDYIQTKLDELSNGVDQSIVRDDLFLNNWQNDKLVRPVDLYNNKGVKLYSISLNDQSVVPNIILGERQDKTDRPAIRPSNWLSMTYVNDKGKLIEGKFPIFYPYIKINDGLGRTPANYHVYSLIGYKQAADPDTNRLNYIPIYGLVSKKDTNTEDILQQNTVKNLNLILIKKVYGIIPKLYKIRKHQLIWQMIIANLTGRILIFI